MPFARVDLDALHKHISKKVSVEIEKEEDLYFCSLRSMTCIHRGSLEYESDIDADIKIYCQ